jgi:hypothetical protein
MELWMKALALIEGARFGSETVKAIGETFDQGSARIKSIFGDDADAVAAARIRLAEAILSIATEGNTDVEDLKNRVIVELAKTTARA